MDPITNPYHPPAAGTETGPLDAEQPQIAARALYSPGQVALATFLGTPLGGTLIMALNYWRWAQPNRARNILIIGSVVTLGLFVVGMLLPASIPSLPFNIVAILVMHQLAKSTQEGTFTEQIRNGARKGSSWLVAGLGLGVSAALVVLVIIFALVLSLVAPDLAAQWFDV